MFQKFDDESQKVLLCAKKEKEKLKHEYVGTEHVMLAMLKKSSEISEMIGITYDEFKRKLIEMVGVGKSQKDLFLYTPLLKRVLENTILNTRERGFNEIHLNDILYSIFEEGEGLAIRLLLISNVDVEKIYYQLLKEIPKKRTKKKSVLDDLGVNLNDKVMNSDIDPITGRDDEINRIIEILCRKTKNNPILVGEAGVGKTAIVEGLAKKIVSGDVPNAIKNKRIISLDMASSVAGTKYRGEFEERMKNLLIELEEDDDIILFIDEIHTIMGAGGAEGAIDASNIFKPALARGNMRLIGATTIKEYKKFIENDAALDRRFQKIQIYEPDRKILKNILLNLKPVYEKHHGVVVKEELIDKIMDLSNKYLKNRREPDKSIDLLDEVCSSVSLKKTSEELEISLLKKELNNIVNNKNKFIAGNNFKHAYELKRNENKLKSKINELELKCKNYKIVTESDINKVLKNMINLSFLEMNENYLYDLKHKLENKVIGQASAIRDIFNLVKKYNCFDSSIVLLLCGSNGVGKSYLASEFGKLIQTNEIIKLNMNEFSDKESISKIIGVPPGYVGYLSDLSLLDKIKNNPSSVVILDEIEKCNIEVLKLILNGINDGYIKNSNSEKIDFSNLFIIMTTNISLDADSIGFGNRQVIVKEKIQQVFGSNFLNSLTKIITLEKLSIDSIKKIIRNEIIDLSKKYNLSIELSNSAFDKLIKLSDFEYQGAKKIKSVLKDYVESLIIDDFFKDEKVVNIDEISFIAS